MIEPAERARSSTGLEVRRLWSVELGATVGPWTAMKVRATVESWTAAVEVGAIDEGAAVRDISVVVEVHPVVAPIGVPVVPSPTESAEEADAPTNSERNPRADGVEAGVPKPAWVGDQRRTIDRLRARIRPRGLPAGSRSS